MRRTFGGYQFEFVGELHPDRDGSGEIVAYAHPLEGIRLNAYGAGPFCRFRLAEASSNAGVYAITLDEDVAYFGECQNLAARFGTAGYGHIAPRNCHHDGQSTNCKINSCVLKHAKAGSIIRVWFYITPSRHGVESGLISALRPPWNTRVESTHGHTNLASRVSSQRHDVDRFREALERELRKASTAGLETVAIRAGNLHRSVGGYPGPRHAMPTCCAAMHAAMEIGDRVVEAPPSGKGASLTIEFRLPRPSNQPL
jgi:hypothetical protein